jgi:hypothetical protein
MPLTERKGKMFKGRKAFILAYLCAILCALGLLASPLTVNAVGQTYRIGYVNTQTGQITYWTTNSYREWQAQREHEHEIDIAQDKAWAISHQTVNTSTHMQGPLIQRVTCSKGRNTFYDLENVPEGGNTPVCFAYAGDTGYINVYCVDEIWTGNNTGFSEINNLQGNTFEVNTPSKFTAYHAIGNGAYRCPPNEFNDVIEVYIY